MQTKEEERNKRRRKQLLTRRIRASSQTLNLQQCEFPIFRRFTRLDAQVIYDRVEDLGGSTTTELAGSGRTKLNEVLSDGFTAEESGNNAEGKIGWRPKIEQRGGQKK